MGSLGKARHSQECGFQFRITDQESRGAVGRPSTTLSSRRRDGAPTDLACGSQRGSSKNTAEAYGFARPAPADVEEHSSLSFCLVCRPARISILPLSWRNIS